MTTHGTVAKLQAAAESGHVDHLRAQLAAARADRNHFHAVAKAEQRALRGIKSQRNSLALSLGALVEAALADGVIPRGMTRASWQALADLHEAGYIHAPLAWEYVHNWHAEVAVLNGDAIG